MCHKKMLARGGVVRTDGPSREERPASRLEETPIKKCGGNTHTLERRYERNPFQKKMRVQTREKRLVALVRKRARR